MPWPNSPVHDVGLRVVQPASFIVFYDANGNTYHAVTNGTDGSPGTDIASQDIWALLNSIDGQLASNGVYHIHIKTGQYTGSATFTPGANKGYFISGDGGDDYGYYGLNYGLSTVAGTVLKYTGASGSAIDTNPNWNSLNGTLNNGISDAQIFKCSDLGIWAPNTSGTVINLRQCQKSTFQNCFLNGNGHYLGSGSVVTGSIGLNLGDAANTGNHMITASLLAGFDTGLRIIADHSRIIGCEFLGHKTDHIYYNTGMDHLIVGAHFFNNGLGSAIAIDDYRTAQTGHTLKMFGIDIEGVNGYTNRNGGYYQWEGNSGVGGYNGPYLQTNFAGGTALGMIINSEIKRTQTLTTLNGTTAGSLIWSMPEQGSSYKRFLGYLNGYQNNTGSAQTVTFSTAFVRTPRLAQDDSGGSVASTSILTLPISMGTPKTGWISIEGY